MVLTSKEIDKRLQAEKSSQQEIERLRRELERLRNQPVKTLIVKESQQVL